MADLILSPSGLEEKYDKPWSLQLRYHESLGETEYVTLCRVNDKLAEEIIKAGSAFWLFGKPDWEERRKIKALEKVRILEEEAKKYEATLTDDR